MYGTIRDHTESMAMSSVEIDEIMYCVIFAMRKYFYCNWYLRIAKILKTTWKYFWNNFSHNYTVFTITIGAWQNHIMFSESFTHKSQHKIFKSHITNHIAQQQQTSEIARYESHHNPKFDVITILELDCICNQ